MRKQFEPINDLHAAHLLWQTTEPMTPPSGDGEMSSLLTLGWFLIISTNSFMSSSAQSISINPFPPEPSKGMQSRNFTGRSNFVPISAIQLSDIFNLNTTSLIHNHRTPR